MQMIRVLSVLPYTVDIVKCCFLVTPATGQHLWSALFNLHVLASRSLEEVSSTVEDETSGFAETPGFADLATELKYMGLRSLDKPAAHMQHGSFAIGR